MKSKKAKSVILNLLGMFSAFLVEILPGHYPSALSAGKQTQDLCLFISVYLSYLLVLFFGTTLWRTRISTRTDIEKWLVLSCLWTLLIRQRFAERTCFLLAAPCCKFIQQHTIWIGSYQTQNTLFYWPLSSSTEAFHFLYPERDWSISYSFLFTSPTSIL